jgi:hypothetical protein
MDKHDLSKRAREIYADEIQYAIEGEPDRVDLADARTRAAERLGREIEGEDMSAVWSGFVDAIARQTERGFEDDLATGQLRFDGALRVQDLTFVPTPKARIRDWLEVDARHLNKVDHHVAKYQADHATRMEIVAEMEAFGGDPTTSEACPHRFAVVLA